MLEKIQRDDFETLVAFVKGDTCIARDEETGAILSKSNGQYILIIEEPYHRSHWSRRVIHSDEDAIERARKVIELREKKKRESES